MDGPIPDPSTLEGDDDDVVSVPEILPGWLWNPLGFRHLAIVPGNVLRSLTRVYRSSSLIWIRRLTSMGYIRVRL